MKQYFCVGTYSEPIRFGTGEVFCGKGKGLYLCALENARIEILSVLPLGNPSFAAIHEAKRRIYAVNEGKEFMGQTGGGISEITYDARGEMRLVQQLPTGGGDPCHVNIAPDGRTLIAANYAGGSVSAWPLDENGGIVNKRQLFQHAGGSVHPRQSEPHAHSTIFIQKDAFLAVDLGKDELLWYALKDGAVRPEAKKNARLAPGSGPRTGEISPDGRNLYIMDELSSAITRLELRGEAPAVRETVAVLPEGMDGGETTNGGADLHIAPDGKMLYASHRGARSLSAFRILADGRLERRATVPCGGETPRNFAIDPSGQLLLCGNQDSDLISIFRLHADGAMEPLGNQDFPTPVCIRFFQGSDPFGDAVGK